MLEDRLLPEDRTLELPELLEEVLPEERTVLLPVERAVLPVERAVLPVELEERALEATRDEPWTVVVRVRELEAALREEAVALRETELRVELLRATLLRVAPPP